MSYQTDFSCRLVGKMQNVQVLAAPNTHISMSTLKRYIVQPQFSVIMPPCCLLYVTLTVKLPSESQQREAGGGVQINQEGMLREAHPNIQTIALHDLYDLHTKCCPAVQRGLQGFACTVWLWCYL